MGAPLVFNYEFMRNRALCFSQIHKFNCRFLYW